MMQHSFAVMAYNDSPYLSACLDSLFAQTVKSTIYISTSTPSEFIHSIAASYGVELFVTAKGQGIAHDWNFSLDQAKTKYVTLAHQDDIYLPEYAGRCITAAEKFDDTIICFTGYDEIVDGKERSGTLLLNVKRIMLGINMPFQNNMRSKFRRKMFLSFGNPVAAPSVMYNMEKLPGFQFYSGFSINMDWDAWYRMSQMSGRFVYVNRSLVKHRIHEGSATTAGLKGNARQSEDLEMFSRFWPFFIAKQLGRIYAQSYKSNEATD